VIENIVIAAAHIQVKSTEPLFSYQNSSYRHFIQNDPLCCDLHIAVKLENLHNTAGLNIIFDSNESWSMYRDKENYCMCFHPATFEHPLWTAIINPQFSAATIYCSNLSLHSHRNQTMVTNPVRYPFDQILLMHHLASRAGILVHAAGIEINGKGYIFAGRSGAGKTTISGQFVSRAFGTMLSDDRVIIRKIDDTFKVFGTPWPGEGGFAVNRGVPLGGIFFIAHHNSNMIEEIIPLTTIEKLLPVASIPWYDHEPMSNILSFCDDLIAHVPSYILHFSLDTGVVDMLEKFISQNEP
jgi:hypothetical protein